MSTDWEQVRREFPALKHWTYLNTATYGQIPRSGNKALLAHHAHRDEMACSDFLTWFDDADALRASIARLIHCTAGDIAFLPNTATALGLLLSGIDWSPGDRIVTLEGEFPNNLYAPHFAGAGVEFVETSWDAFYTAITPGTRLVALSMLNYASGFRPPLQEISLYLRQRGVLLYVDGTQGVGALACDMRELQPSLLAVHAYKWMTSPTGVGFMYVAPELRANLRPNVIGWRSDKRWREVDNLHHGRPELKDTAEKYEGGGLPFTLLYAMKAAVDLMLEIGSEAIENRVLSLADTVRGRLRELGGQVADGVTPIIAARFEGCNIPDVSLRLKEQRIVVSARHGYLRVSPHLYNNEADIDTLMTALKPIL